MSNYNNIPTIKIGNLEVKLFQGPMGVGVSQASLASAVANEGGAGIIASVGLGILNGYFTELLNENRERIKRANNDERKVIFAELYTLANQNALRAQIRRARSLTNGVIGVNVMFALSDYVGLTKIAVEEGVDLMTTGAGPSLDFAKYVTNPNIMIGPRVNSAKGAIQFCRVWGRLGHAPNFIDVEGPKAGGHLGYSKEELADPEFVSSALERIIHEVVLAVKPYEEQFQRKIPVIAAGGIFYGGDIRKAVEEWGAAGAQMATRFVTTHECDANIKFKQAYLDCKPGDLRIINSPVGMPGRAINNDFLIRVDAGETIPIVCPYRCLRTCKPESSPYCIARALVEAQQGKFENGYVFAGANAGLCHEIVSVREVFEGLNREYAENKRSD